MKFEQIKIGDILMNKKTKITFKVCRLISDKVLEVSNQKYLGMTDYINTNTVDDYELVDTCKKKEANNEGH